MRTRLPGLLLAGCVGLAGAGALAQAEAERRLDAAIERLRSALGDEARLEIGARRVDPVTGQATLTAVVLSRGKDRATIPELRLAELSETRIGRAELLNATLRAGDGTTAESGRIRLAGLALPVPGKAIDLAALAVEALEVEGLAAGDPDGNALRLGRLALSDWRGVAIGAGGLEGLEWRGAPADPVDFRLGRVAVEAVTLPLDGDELDPGAFRAGAVAVEGAELRDALRGVSLSFGRLALRDWVPGRPAALGMEGLQLAAPGPTGRLELSLARVVADGVDAVRTLVAIAEELQVPDPFPGTPQRLVAEGLETALDGRPLLALGRLLVEAGLEGGIAHGALAAENLRFVPPREQAGWLEGLGYREVAGGLELRGRMPRDGGRAELGPLRLAWQDAATLTVTALLDGVPGAPPEGTELDPAATMAAMAAATLPGLTLTLDDHGLLGRVLAGQARAMRVPEARLREQWAQMALAMPLPGAAPPRRGGAPAGKPAADPLLPLREALAAFIRQPGVLEISLRPPKPLPVADMAGLAAGSPAETVQRLGLTVVAR